MPSGKKISWEVYDHLIVTHLPTMTIASFVKSYLPGVSPKAVGVRARKLGIKPAIYQPTDEHKQKIATTIAKLGSAEVEIVRQLRGTHSVDQIADILCVDELTVHRAITKHNIVLSNAGRERAREASRTASVGKEPWNKGGELSEETKIKIGEAVSGKKNGQYGRGMTEDEKERWRKSYFAAGIHRMREWIQSPDGQSALVKMLLKTTTSAFRQGCSERMSSAILDGKVSNVCRGVATHVVTTKGGEFTTKSSYETRYVAKLEADPEVVSFIYEPLRIQYEFEGINFWYIPDFLVRYHDREELVEVKPEAMATWPKNIAKFEAGRNYHIGFRVVTEVDL